MHIPSFNPFSAPAIRFGGWDKKTLEAAQNAADQTKYSQFTPAQAKEVIENLERAIISSKHGPDAPIDYETPEAEFRKIGQYAPKAAVQALFNAIKTSTTYDGKPELGQFLLEQLRK